MREAIPLVGERDEASAKQAPRLMNKAGAARLGLAFFALALCLAAAQDSSRSLPYFTSTGQQIAGGFDSATHTCRLADGTIADCQVMIEGFPAAAYGTTGDGTSDQQLLDGASSTGVGAAIFYVGASPGSAPVKVEYTTGATAATIAFWYHDSNWAALVSESGADDCWTASATSNEWYFDPANCTAPAQPAEVFVDSASTPYTLYASGTCGALSAGQWCWGDNDTIGQNVPYVFATADPDAGAIQVIAMYGSWSPAAAASVPNSGITQASVPCLEVTCDHGEGYEIQPKGHPWVRAEVRTASSGSVSLWIGRAAQAVY